MAVSQIEVQTQLHPLFGAYEARLKRLRRDRRTLLNFRRAVSGLEEFLDAQGLRPDQADPILLEEYFAQLDLKPSSKRTHLANVRAAYNYALRRGVIDRDPTLDVEIEKTPDEEPRIIPAAELRAIRETIRCDRDWVAFHLLAYTGMRRTEIRTLHWDDVLLPEQTIRVLGKGGKLRLVPIHPTLGEILAEAAPEPGRSVIPARGTYVAEETFHGTVKRLSKVFTPHDYRRTVASSLALNGVSDPVIDKIMGWAPRSVGRRYYINVATPELLRAILRLYADDPV